MAAEVLEDFKGARLALMTYRKGEKPRELEEIIIAMEGNTDTYLYHP